MKTIKIKDLTLELNDEQVKELKLQLNNEKQGRWKPEIGKNYWYVYISGKIRSTIYNNDDVDNFRHSIGNMYETEEKAEEVIETGWVAQLQARKRIDDYIAEKGYDTNVDWSDIHTGKYYIMYDFRNKKLERDYTDEYKYSNLPYFVKSEDRDDVMEHCADDYKLLLGVE